MEGDLAGLADCERAYGEALEEKAAAVKRNGGPAAEELLRLEARIADLEGRKREIREAMEAGWQAQSAADSVLDSLDSAEGWGTWDLLGGGLIADLAKYDHLNEAQRAVEQLQDALRSFKTELADVTIQAELQVGVDGFLRFADYFFDGLFTDWAVLDQISRSQAQVADTRRQIEQVCARLESMHDAAEQEQAACREQLDARVVEAPL